MADEHAELPDEMLSMIDGICSACKTNYHDTELERSCLIDDGVGLVRLSSMSCTSCGQLNFVAVFRPGTAMPNLPNAFRFITELLETTSSDEKLGKRH